MEYGGRYTRRVTDFSIYERVERLVCRFSFCDFELSYSMGASVSFGTMWNNGDEKTAYYFKAYFRVSHTRSSKERSQPRGNSESWIRYTTRPNVYYKRIITVTVYAFTVKLRIA